MAKVLIRWIHDLFVDATYLEGRIAAVETICSMLMSNMTPDDIASLNARLNEATFAMRIDQDPDYQRGFEDALESLTDIAPIFRQPPSS